MPGWAWNYDMDEDEYEASIIQFELGWSLWPVSLSVTPKLVGSNTRFTGVWHSRILPPDLERLKWADHKLADITVQLWAAQVYYPRLISAYRAGVDTYYYSLVGMKGPMTEVDWNEAIEHFWTQQAGCGISRATSSSPPWFS